MHFIKGKNGVTICLPIIYDTKNDFYYILYKMVVTENCWYWLYYWLKYYFNDYNEYNAYDYDWRLPYTIFNQYSSL